MSACGKIGGGENNIGSNHDKDDDDEEDTHDEALDRTPLPITGAKHNV